MSNRDKIGRKNRHRSQISRQILTQYVLTVVGFVAALLLCYFLAWVFCNQFIWLDTNPLYYILKFIQATSPFWGTAVVFVGVIFITHHYLSKPLSYLDEVIAAAEQLSQSNEKPIILSEPMKSVQNELNLTREQALRSERNAKEAEQRKNDLIVYLAHDLKTPLTSVIGYMTLLRDEPQISPELRAKYTGIALSKAERLEDLINEFFDITRFNLTHLTLEEETVNLTRMLEQIAFEFQPVLAEKELTCETRLAPDVQLICDPDKLERVFDNLLRNALSYSYPKSQIVLSLEQRQNHVTIRVQNHGKTIPPEKLSRIFEQFFRLDSARASSTGGAGLGLAIAKEIVELHGGIITAESVDEKVALTVRLPLSRQKIV